MLGNLAASNNWKLFMVLIQWLDWHLFLYDTFLIIVIQNQFDLKAIFGEFISFAWGF